MNGQLDLQIDVLPARSGIVPVVLGRIAHRYQRLLGRTRHDRLAFEWIAGTPLIVMPEVFNPKRMRTGAYFASLLQSQLEVSDAKVLDLGTGSGIAAVFAARRARKVVAVDVSAAAVRCARINAALNHLDDRIDVRHGDLFAPVSGQQFDVVLFNPPFFQGTPSDDFDRAWRSADVAERFASGLGRHLKPSGFALLLLSSFGGSRRFLTELALQGFEARRYATRRYFNETLAVYRIDRTRNGSVA